MAEEAVLKYLASTNRPYSANDIMLNLHKQWGKTGVQRALDALVAASSVLEKTYGKQKVYVIKQNEQEGSIDEELKQLDQQIAQYGQELKTIEDELKIVNNELSALTSEKPISQILEEIDTIKREVEDLSKSTEEASINNTEPVSPDKVKAIKDKNAAVLKEYRRRKRMCMDIVEMILESYPKSKKALIEEIGIETDEMVDFINP